MCEVPRAKYGTSFWTIPSSAGTVDSRTVPSRSRIMSSCASAVCVTTVASTSRSRASAAERSASDAAGSRNTRVSSPNPGSAPTKTTFRVCSSSQRLSDAVLFSATASRRS